MYRRCGKCQNELSESAFNRSGSGRQYWCRECFRAYFRERGQTHIAQVAAARAARQKPLREWLDAYLAANPCVDCGESDRRVLEFDHVRGKERAVSALFANGAKLSRLQQEVDRCDVVCANCHRRRTAERAGWYRLGTGSAPSRLRPRQQRNVDWVYQLLARSACIDCGCAEPLLLEFDHRCDKRTGVTQLAWDECSLETIAAEAAKCDIRCCNCHRRRTATVEGWRRVA